MKKCRYMSQKIIVPIFSLLLAVSAFFYAPINVEASDSLVVSGSTNQATLGADGFTRIYYQSDVSSISSDLTSSYISLAFDYDVSFSFQSAVGLRNYTASMIIGDISFTLFSKPYPTNTGNITSLTETGTCSFIVPRSALSTVRFLCNGTIPFSEGSYIPDTFTTNVIFEISNISQTAISSGSGSDYQNGYDAGYSQGFNDGETSGYSDGFQAGVDSVDTDSYYNSGFQAGVDSVDTQSYYDSGYSAGYNVGVQESYDIGYSAGYDAAMERIESWGADGTEYPVLKLSSEFGSMSRDFWIHEQVSEDFEFNFDNRILSFDEIVHHDHVYKIVGYVKNPSVTVSSTSSNSLFVYSSIYSSISFGDVFCNIKYVQDSETEFEFYVSGNRMSDTMRYTLYVDDGSMFNVDTSERLYCTVDNLYFYIFDYGPASGNNQNYIANQTDDLTNGYDDSLGQETSSHFSDGVAEYEEVEGSLFTSAKSGLTDYQFFDLESVPAVVTGISFVTATMTGIFNAMGGASGAGIVLSVLFSVMLVSIVAGLYRYFVSSGKGGKHDRKGGKG